MACRIAHSSHDENGKYHGGKAGNQTNECEVRDWYNRPWTCVIRFKDGAMAEKCARFMELASANRNIGYDQYQRNTLHTELLKVGFDVSKVSRPCETDCSALVSDACIYAGIAEKVMFVNGNLSYTGNLKSRLVSTGLVTVYVGREYIAGTTKLKRGDILLNESHHVAVVVSNGEVSSTTRKSNEDIARECINGLWGNGAVRKNKLTSAGYDYATIQNLVNQILNKKEPTPVKTHIVVKGENLWNIAKKYYGDGMRYQDIKALNGLTSDVIRVGQILKLP